MGVGVSVFAGMFFGIIIGIILTIVILFLKTWIQTRRALKNKINQDIINSIKFQQEEKLNAIKEEEVRRGYSRRDARDDERFKRGAGFTETSKPKPTSSDSTSKRPGVSVSNPSFTFRD